MNAQVQRLKESFFNLSAAGKVIAFVIAFVVGAVLVAGGGMVGHRIASARYSKKEAARMKQVQAALATADAATKRAEAAEAKAELLAQKNAAKEKNLSERDRQIIEEGKKTDAEISETLRRDVASIDGDASSFERCEDICSRLERAAAANPNLAPFRCAPDSCADADRTPGASK